MYVGERVKLRPFESEDVEPYRAWINDPEIARLVDRATPVTPEEHRAWYQTLTSAPDNLVFAVERLKDGAFIGLVWLYGIHWRHRRAEVRIVLGDRTAWGGGHGTDALRLIRGIAFGAMQLDKLWADVLSTNPRGVAAFERAGFVREGLLVGDRLVAGRRVDVVRLGALRGADEVTA
jgi:RimJ/RimL family protein N-acetyltransferase